MAHGTYETGDDKKRPSTQQEPQRQDEKLLEHHVELKNLFYDVLPSTQRMLLKALSGLERLESFYLVGGTGLALQIGHRVSMDFDFFSPNEFSQHQIIADLSKIGQFELFEEARDTLHGSLDGAKLSFLRYRYPLLKPLHSIQHLRVADIFDIALMKLSAIAAHGAKRDFIDLYFLLQHFSLEELLTSFSIKYGEERGHHYHLLKSLVYFQDAENEPMPLMIQPVEWDDVRHFMVQKVKEIGFAGRIGNSRYSN